MKSPHILYDSQIFDFQKIGGISRYFCEIATRLHYKFNISVLYSENYYLKKYTITKHLYPLPQYLFKRYKSKLLYKNLKYSKKLLKQSSPYLLHATYYEPYFLKYIGNNPYVITVHDMIYEKLPEYFSNNEAEYVIKQKKEVISKANRIIAISENTKKDLVELLNIDQQKIDVIYHGTSMRRCEQYTIKHLPEKYILFVGSRHSYKNFDRFIEAFSLLAQKDSKLHLVCTGNEFSLDEEEKLSKLLIRKKTLQINASDKELSELYTRASLFVFPSLYEGFGIPILEAYACHCPIAISNTSCFPEIAGDAAVYFDPYSVKDIANAIEKIIYSPSKTNELIGKGIERLKLFSWEKAAAETEETYKKTLQEYGWKLVNT